MPLDSGDIASMLVAIIASVGGYLAHRASAKANVVTARTSAEEEAFVRARKFDVDTIQRQDAEIEELRELVRIQREELDLLRPLVPEVKFLRTRVARLEEALTSHEKEPSDEQQHDRHVPVPPE